MLTNRKQAFLSSFFQCIKGLVVLAESRRTEERKMEEKKMYCLKKKEEESSVTGESSAVEMTLP